MDINAAMTTSTTAMINSIGKTATYTVAGNPATTVTITILFDNEYKSVDMETGAVMSTAPMAYCKSADVSAFTQGRVLTIDTVSYTVTDLQPDGTGMTTLILRKTS